MCRPRWPIEFTDEFREWWDQLSVLEQGTLTPAVQRLELLGPTLRFPLSSDVRGSRHGNMRELRIQTGRRRLRVFYAFDPRRLAILLIGGNKTGNDRFYEVFVPRADNIYDQYLREIQQEGLIT